jgi:hypothetical protein
MESNVVKVRLAFMHEPGERPLVDERTVRALRADPPDGRLNSWSALGVT